jgi:hypothetical protein
MPRPVMLRRSTWFAAIVAVALVVPVRAAGAKATVGMFSDTHTETGTTALPECLPPDLVGSLNLINTIAGHFTETATGFHVEGTETESYRVDFPDGRYVLGVATSHFGFNVSGSGQTTTKTVIQEPRTIYDADGRSIGRVFIHFVSVITYRDANANGVPDDGEITANVERFFFGCG